MSKPGEPVDDVYDRMLAAEKPKNRDVKKAEIVAECEQAGILPKFHTTISEAKVSHYKFDTGGRLVNKQTGATFAEDIQAEKPKFPEYYGISVDPEVDADPVIVDQAVNGNMTARGILAQAPPRGIGPVALTALLRRRGIPSITDRRPPTPLVSKEDLSGTKQRTDAPRNLGADNPWSKAGWSISKQGAAYKADPVKAERMMRDAGVTLGALRPVR